MHTFMHHHEKTDGSKAGLTQGLIMNLGPLYDLMVWSIDTFLLRGALRKFRIRTIDLAQLQAGDTVLDVGCGTGLLAIEASRRLGVTSHVYGIDPGPRQITRARSNAKRAHLAIDFQIGVIEHLNFPDQTFNVVFSTWMMHHLPDDLKRSGIAEIARVLKPGGRLVIVDFKSTEQAANQPMRFGAGSLGVQDLPQLLQEAGLSQIESGEMPFSRPLGSVKGAGFVLGQKVLS